MNAELQCQCQGCGNELPPSHTGPCPHCGRIGKDCRVTTTTSVGVRASEGGTHKPKWSSRSLALFFGILAIVLAVVVPGVLMLLPFNPGLNYGILIGLSVAAGFFFWWQRYRVLMIIRRVESRLGGKKQV